MSVRPGQHRTVRLGAPRNLAVADAGAKVIGASSGSLNPKFLIDGTEDTAWGGVSAGNVDATHPFVAVDLAGGVHRVAARPGQRHAQPRAGERRPTCRSRRTRTRARGSRPCAGSRSRPASGNCSSARATWKRFYTSPGERVPGAPAASGRAEPDPALVPGADDARGGDPVRGAGEPVHRVPAATPASRTRTRPTHRLQGGVRPGHDRPRRRAAGVLVHRGRVRAAGDRTNGWARIGSPPVRLRPDPRLAPSRGRFRQVWWHGRTHPRHERHARRRPRSALGQGDRRRAVPGHRDRVPRGPRPARRRGRADRSRRPAPRRRCAWSSTPRVPDRYDAWVTPDARRRLDLRGPGLVRPGRHLAARRRDQDPRRGRRRADVPRGTAAARARQGRPRPVPTGAAHELLDGRDPRRPRHRPPGRVRVSRRCRTPS